MPSTVISILGSQSNYESFKPSLFLRVSIGKRHSSLKHKSVLEIGGGGKKGILGYLDIIYMIVNPLQLSSVEF